jgi:hypothetical protein
MESNESKSLEIYAKNTWAFNSLGLFSIIFIFSQWDCF